MTIHFCGLPTKTKNVLAGECKRHLTVHLCYLTGRHLSGRTRNREASFHPETKDFRLELSVFSPALAGLMARVRKPLFSDEH